MQILKKNLRTKFELRNLLRSAGHTGKYDPHQKIKYKGNVT